MRTHSIEKDLTIEYAQAGACIQLGDNGDVERFQCSMLPGQCPQGFQFRSPHWIHAQSKDHPTTVCLTQESLQAITIGQCTSIFDDKICTASASSCQMTEDFVPSSNLCNIAANNHDGATHALSLYGQCSTYDFTDSKPPFCGWSNADCPMEVTGDWDYHVHKNSYGWSHAKDSYKLSCTCDKVQVGACVKDPSNVNAVITSDRYCAVSKEACDDGMEYLPVITLRDEHKVRCLLCKDILQAYTTPSPTTLSHYQILNRDKPNAAPGSAPVISGDSGDGLSNVAIAGITGGVIGAALVLFGIYVLFQIKKRRAVARAGKAIQEEIEMQQNQEEAHETSSEATSTNNLSGDYIANPTTNQDFVI